MTSIASVLRPEFARSWQEAVAIVQEVASQLADGASVPAPGDLLLDADGTLTFGFASESTESPVASLARLLGQLLEPTQAPAALQDLVAENTGAQPAHATVQGFSRALAFFERPGRHNDLAAVGSRLAGVRPQRPAAEPEPSVEISPEREVERLRAKLAAAPEGKKGDQKERRKVPHRQVAIAACGIAALAAAGVFVARRDKPVRPVATVSQLLDRGEDRIAKVLSRGLDRLGGVTGDREPAGPSTVDAKSVEPAPRTRPRTRISASGPDPDRTGVRQRVEAAVSAVAAVLDPPALDPVPPIDDARRAVRPEMADSAEIAPDRVYSKADPGVRAPILSRPQLPSQPAPSATTSYFEILVNERGRVDQVRLVSPVRRYRDGMLIAAAKAWIFQPARLDGRPVKYWLRVPILGSNPLQ